MSLTQGRAFIDDLENNEGATFQLHALCLGKYLHESFFLAYFNYHYEQ